MLTERQVARLASTSALIVTLLVGAWWGFAYQSRGDDADELRRRVEALEERQRLASSAGDDSKSDGVLSGAHRFSSATADENATETDEVEGPQGLRAEIRFSPAFSEAPRVLAGLAGHPAGETFEVQPREVTKEGFTLLLHGLAPSSDSPVDVFWLAHPSEEQAATETPEATDSSATSSQALDRPSSPDDSR